MQASETAVTSIAGAIRRLEEPCNVARNGIAQSFIASGSPFDAPQQLTFQEFAADVRQRVAALRRIGVQADTLVAAMLPLSPESYPTQFALMSCATIAPLNYYLESDTLAHFIRATGAKFLLTAAQFPEDSTIIEKVQRVRKAIPGLVHLTIGSGPSVPDAIHLDAFAREEAQSTWPAELFVPYPERIAAVFHTGGTSGIPKLVPHTEAMYLAMLKSCGERQGTTTGEVMLSGMPLFHTSGALQSGLVPVLNGVHVVIPSVRGFREPSAIRNYWRFVERYAITVGGSVPTVLAALSATTCDSDVSSLKHILCGGAPLSKATIAAIAAITGGAEVLEGWGMTETCGFSVLNPKGRTKVGSAGTPFAGVEVQVRKVGVPEADTEGVPANTIGELVVRGDIVIRRYQDERPASFTSDGWLRTGDLARIDEDGFVWITGREKDLIIRSGHNIDPALIESPAYEHPAVLMAAAVGRPDRYAGELPILFVKLKDGAATDEAELLEFIRTRIQERAAIPKAVHIVPEMPLSGPGKISKLVLRRETIRATFQHEIDNLAGVRPGDVTAAVVDDAQAGAVVLLSMPPGGIASDTVRKLIDGCLRDYTVPYRWKNSEAPAPTR